MIAPRVVNVPDGVVGTHGDAAVELARVAGLELDDWQAHAVRFVLAVDRRGRWPAMECGLCVPRQNGKGAIVEVVELHGLFLDDSMELQIHTAHLFPTAREAWRRIVGLIEATPELLEEVKRINRAHGEEGVELRNGKRLLFKARGSGSGRGFSGDRVILDEPMYLRQTVIGDLMPTMSARPNPQLVYTGSSVDRYVHADGQVFSRLRHRGVEGDDRLLWLEWSLPFDEPEDVPESVARDPGAWAEANPAWGARINEDFTETERRSMDPRTFAVERLGVGAWWRQGVSAGGVIPLDVWDSLIEPGSGVGKDLVFAFDVSPDRSSAAVGVAGRRDDGRVHVEVVDVRRGVGWVADRVAGLVGEHGGRVVCDGIGPAAPVVESLRGLRVKVDALNTRAFTSACGGFYDAVMDGQVAHLGQPVLADALRLAEKRDLGDAWAWSRKVPGDVSPLVAVTLAWGQATSGKRKVTAWAEAW